MSIARNLATPLTAGAFLLSAVTGVLIFFHLDVGLNKAAHEWLSWALLTGVVLHLVSNYKGFKRYFSSRLGLGLMGTFVLVLALSFVIPKAKREPLAAVYGRALAQVPLSTLALVARRSPQELRNILLAEGLQASSDEQTLEELAGPDKGKGLQLLERLIARR